jgi:hypothetical protein
MPVKNHFRSWFVLIFALGSVLAFCVRRAPSAEESAERPAAKSDDKKASNKYLRIVRDGKDRVTGLETAIVSFRPASGGADGVQVDLVAAVHVADKAYYQELNKRFAGYDVVLYELVAPQGTRIPKGGRKGKGGNFVSSIQLGMKDMLELEYQLDQVDYTRKNFVHADLSPDEFMQSMRDRKEGFTDIFVRLMAYGIAKQANGKDEDSVQLLMALFDKNRALALKRAMAEQFEDIDGAMSVLDGPKGSTLISQRNKRALEVLKKQIATGKKKIAIFYGGGHMADMEKHLRADFALKPDKTEWLRAWDMK